ncbi:MAG: SUMF1/EgtB/PvdO family nonheme iron enzyme [Planctomycetota bacterium]
MSNPKSYRVFVSSTYDDNRRRRSLARQAIREAEMVAFGMEDMTAERGEQVERCLREAREADVVLAILGWRYGWVPDAEDGRSITELEIDAAIEAGRPLLVFRIDEDEPAIVKRDFDTGDGRGPAFAKLDALKVRLAERATATFTNDTLQLKVYEALRGWRAEHEDLPAARPPEPDDERRYRELAFAHHREAPLLGLTGMSFEVLLTDLHVEVEAHLDLRDGEQAEFGDHDEAKLALAGREASRALKLRRAFADAERRKRRGMVLLGEPGSGKTTHLKRMLLWVLDEGSETVGLPPGYVPVFLPLSAFARPAEGFLAFAQRWIETEFQELGAEFAERLLRRDKLLFLLDGLDELPAGADRALVAQELKTALGDHAGWRALASCRYAGYRERSRLAPRYLELHLPTFTPEQVVQFAENWFGIAERQLQPDPDQAPRVAAERAAALIECFRAPGQRSARMAQLRSNPLMLATLCLVFRRNEKLPRRRSALYRMCVHVLLERWTKRAEPVGGLTAEASLALLAPLAAWMHAQRAKRVPEEDVEVHLGQLLGEHTDLAPRAFLRAVREDCGLLTGWSDAHYGFLHLGLQEYLTALDLHGRAGNESGQDQVVQLLAAGVADDWWQEVVLLVLSLPEPDLFEPVIAACLDQRGAAEHEQIFTYALEDAHAPGAAPFVALVEREPGDDAELWQRQLLALRLLREVDPAEAERCAAALRGHPFSELSALSLQLTPEPEELVLTPDPVVVHAGSAGLRVGTGGGGAERITADRGGYELIRIPGGAYLMGSPGTEDGRDDSEGPQHHVRIAAFHLGVAPVTNEEYARFLNARPRRGEPRSWADRRFNQPNQPVVGISWEEALAYCEWAGLALPSEAQWEYACRAGSTTAYWSGSDESDLARVGWYRGNSGGELHVVGQLRANAFGLHDMHGSVLEWCRDPWRPSYYSALIDHDAWENSHFRATRGGSCRAPASHARSASRSFRRASGRFNSVGFRPAGAVTE